MKKIFLFLCFMVHVQASSLELMWNADAYFLSHDEYAQIVNKLIVDPLSILSKIKKTEAEVMNLLSDNKLTPTMLKKYFKKAKDFSGFASISECTTCPLTRFCKTGNREFYEKTILTYLKNYMSKESINYVSFAAGGLFQDAIVLAKIAKNYTIKHMNFHIVDPMYAEYIKIMHMLDHKDSIDLSEMQNFSFKNISLQKETDPKMQCKCELYMIDTHQTLLEFVSFVHYLSNKKIQVYVHANAQEYLDFCKNHQEMLPDFITAIDFDPMSSERALTDYYKLMLYALKKDGCSVFCDLMTNFYKLSFIQKADCSIVSFWYYFYAWCKNTSTDAAIYEGLRSFVSIYFKKNDVSEKDISLLEQKLSNHEFSKLDNGRYLKQYFEFNVVQLTTLCKASILAGMILGTKKLIVDRL